MRTAVAILMLAIGCLAISPCASAHHGNAGYDTSKLITERGAVTEYHFQNPHIEVFIDVKKDDHSVEKWHGELNVLRLEKVLLANGTEIFPRGGNGVPTF